jgi:hypothetical protein
LDIVLQTTLTLTFLFGGKYILSLVLRVVHFRMMH